MKTHLIEIYKTNSESDDKKTLQLEARAKNSKDRLQKQ